MGVKMKTMKKKTVIITNIYTIFMLLLGVVGGGCFVVFSFLDGYNPLAIVSSAAGNAIFKEEIFSDSISGFIRIWNGKELFSSDLFLILSGISFIIVVSLLTFFLCLELAVRMNNWLCYFYIKSQYGDKFSKRWIWIHKKNIANFRDKLLNTSLNDINRKSELESASYEHYIKWKQHYESSMSYDDWKRKVLKGT